MADAASHEENGTHRRCNITKTHVENQHHAELNVAHAEALGNGQENRCKDQDGRGDIHEHADNQQDNVHEQEDDVLVAGQTHESAGNGCRNAGVSHDEGHCRGSRDQEQNDAAGLRRIKENPQEGLHVDALVKNREDQAVEHRNARALRGGENTGNDAADNDDDQQKARYRIPNRLHHTLAPVKAGGLHAGLLGTDKSHHHTAQSHQNARNITGHKQGGDGDAAGHSGIHNEGRSRRDQQACGGRGNVGCRRICRIIAVLLLDRADTAAHGRGCCHRGTGQRTEKHVAENIGLGHGAGNLADEKLRKVDKTLGDTAVVHDVARQNEEGHCQQREGLHAGIHLLHGDEGDLIPGQRGHGCHNG